MPTNLIETATYDSPVVVPADADPGNAAYYTFHATWDLPSDLAFAALGTVTDLLGEPPARVAFLSPAGPGLPLARCHVCFAFPSLGSNRWPGSRTWSVPTRRW